MRAEASRYLALTVANGACARHLLVPLGGRGSASPAAPDVHRVIAYSSWSRHRRTHIHPRALREDIESTRASRHHISRENNRTCAKCVRSRRRNELALGSNISDPPSDSRAEQHRQEPTYHFTAPDEDIGIGLEPRRVKNKRPSYLQCKQALLLLFPCLWAAEISASAVSNGGRTGGLNENPKIASRMTSTVGRRDSRSVGGG